AAVTVVVATPGALIWIAPVAGFTAAVTDVALATEAAGRLTVPCADSDGASTWTALVFGVTTSTWPRVGSKATAAARAGSVVLATVAPVFDVAVTVVPAAV